MKKQKDILTEKYLATAPIGQAGDVVKIKQEWIKINLDQLFPKKTSECLEIGPGQGELLMYWKQNGFKNISSIDISEDVVSHIQKLGFKCELVNDSSEYLLKHQNTYDLIVLNDVLEHVPREEIVSLVESIRISLAKGGKVIIKSPNAQSPHFSVGLFGDLTHIQAFTETSLSQLFEASGFDHYYFLPEKSAVRYNPMSIIANYLIKPVYFFWIRKIRQATGHASPRILSQAIIAVAEK